MELNGQYTFADEQEIVWQHLMDPAVIAGALPGVDELMPVEGEENAWRAEAKISIAAINGRYGGFVRMSEQTPPKQYRLTVNGEGQQSIINGTALITLSYNEETHETLLTWQADANISGKLASIGQRVVKAAAAMLSKQFFSAVANQIPAQETKSS